jgi:hypothetical protein
MPDAPWPGGNWSRDIAENWVDTAERLASHPATPSEVRNVLMKYVRGTRQQFCIADSGLRKSVSQE